MSESANEPDIEKITEMSNSDDEEAPIPPFHFDLPEIPELMEDDDLSSCNDNDDAAPSLADVDEPAMSLIHVDEPIIIDSDSDVEEVFCPQPSCSTTTTRRVRRPNLASTSAQLLLKTLEDLLANEKINEELWSSTHYEIPFADEVFPPFEAILPTLVEEEPIIILSSEDEDEFKKPPFPYYSDDSEDN